MAFAKDCDHYNKNFLVTDLPPKVMWNKILSAHKYFNFYTEPF